MNIPVKKDAFQERSKATDKRIIMAAGELIKGRIFSEISVADIAHHAGVAVGSIYSRYKNKNAILRVLYENYIEEATEQFQREIDRWEGLNLEGRLEGLNSLFISISKSKGGLVRSAALAFRIKENEKVFAKLPKVQGVYKNALEKLKECRDEVKNDDPEEAFAFVISMHASMFRDLVVFGVHVNVQSYKWSVNSLGNQILKASLALLLKK